MNLAHHNKSCSNCNWRTASGCPSRKGNPCNAWTPEKTKPQEERVTMHRIGYRTPTGKAGVCGVRVVSVDGSKKIVILTELADNPGMSVTNSWPFIASAVYYQLFPEFDPKGIIWVEHYGQQSYRHPHSDGDRYDLVELEWDDTRHEYILAQNRHPWRPAPAVLVNHFNQLLRRAS